MASEGSPLSPTPDKREELTCALCLDVYRDPKLLPCAHTFCQKCLDDLIQQHHDGTFPCPVCRKETEILSEGASGFHTNPYFDQKELETVRDGTTCSLHGHKKLDIFCVDCDLLICGDCKQSVHLHHKSQNLQNVMKNADEQLSKDKVRLRAMKEHVEQMIPERGRNAEEYRTKRAAVEQNIRGRHGSLVVKADQYLKEALESLEEICSETENLIFKEVQTAQNNVTRLAKLGQKIDTAVQIGEDCKVVSTALEMKTGYGSEYNVRKMKLTPLQSVSRVAHLADPPNYDAVFFSMRDFIGRGQQVTYPYVDPEVRVKQEVQGGDHADSVVSSVIPDDENTYVSFEPSYKDTEPCVKLFSTTTRVISDLENKGKLTYKIRETLDSEYRSTYIKCSTEKIYCFHTECYWDCDWGNVETVTVRVTTVVSEEPLEKVFNDLFALTCGCHRAASLHSSEGLLAVVEEPEADDEHRQVKLFRGQQDSLRKPAVLTDTYQSPLSPCQPADVCFFTLGGKEVLLIADELNDAIHVTEVEDDRLTFSRFLAPGCPLLVQPTALNADRQGRLWVGCRGGALLTVEPLPPAVADAGKGDPGDPGDPGDLGDHGGGQPSAIIP